MTRLSVNIDHVATIRQSRDTVYPDPVHAAVLVQMGGADGITVHPREDRRHIQDRDVYLLKQTLQVPLTLEMALTDDMVNLALDVMPHACTLVPELREERTTESGLLLIGHEKKYQPKIQRLLDAGIIVSIFIDAVQDEITAAKQLGAQFIELHTGPYALAATSEEEDREFTIVANAAEHASHQGLSVNVGHGLHYRNTARMASLPMVKWVHTGHSIIAHALFVGLERAVQEMQDILRYHAYESDKD